MSWKDVALRALRTVEPYAHVAERAAQLAVHMQRLTPIGAVGLASAGINAAREYLERRQGPGTSYAMLAPRGSQVRAYEAAGASSKALDNGEEYPVEVSVGGETFFVFADCSIGVSSLTPEFTEWVRQALDRELPSTLRIARSKKGPITEAFDLTRIESPLGGEIAESTSPLLGAGRCILLDGRPGVGKTTMAQEIARRMRRGRVVVLEPSALGENEDSPKALNNAPGADVALALHVLSPDILIVDDIDKMYLPLGQLEAMRSAARLVILTANNGDYDEVLDAAKVRCGRIDEVFTIKATHAVRAEPFDRLDDATWERVREWPVAFLNELAQRIRRRGTSPEALRIDDLAGRVGRKTRSGDVLR